MENGKLTSAEHKEVGDIRENAVGLNGVTPAVGVPVADAVSEELSKDVDVIGDGTEAEAATDVVSVSNVPAEEHQAKQLESAVANVVVEATFSGEGGHSAVENAADTHAACAPISGNGDDMMGNADVSANASIFEMVEDAKPVPQQQAINQQWEPPQVVYQQEQEQQSASLELQPPAEQPSAAVSVAPLVTTLPSSAPSIQPQEDSSVHSQTLSQPENQLHPQPQAQSQAQLQAQSQAPPSQPQQQQQQAVVYTQRTGSSYSVRIRLA